MCGISGVIGKQSSFNKIIMQNLLKESQIRGRHATGISYISSGNLFDISESIPADKFIQQDFVPKSKVMIGHVRYSTSDIRYNQPIANDDSKNQVHLVHNGIISQSPSNEWEEEFGYSNFNTKNDTELLVKCIQSGHNPFKKFPKSSIACGYIQNDRMRCFRNSTRPLWLFNAKQKGSKESFIMGFASTNNIIKRAFSEYDFDLRIIRAQPFNVYEFNDDNIYVEPQTHAQQIFQEDQQRTTKSELKYVK